MVYTYGGDKTNLLNSPEEKAQKTLLKVIEDRKVLIKSREDQAKELQDSMEHLKDESQTKNQENKKLIAEFRERMLVCDNEQIIKDNAMADALEQRINDLEAKLDDYKMESKGKWISFKREYNYYMNDIEKLVRILTIEDRSLKQNKYVKRERIERKTR